MPRALAVRFERALKLLDGKTASDAEKLLREILNGLEPQFAEARSLVHYNLCLAIKKQYGIRQALDRVLEYLKDSPSDTAHNLLAGSYLYDLHRYAQAAPYLAKGLEAGWAEVKRFTGDPAQVACQLADCYRFTGKKEEAEKICREVLKRRPGHRSARKILAFLALSRRDFTRAASLLESLQREDPSDPALTFSLSKAYLEGAKPRLAVAAIERHWAKASQRTDDLRIMYARALLAAGKPKQAVGVIAEVLILKPELEDAYVVLADALARAGFKKQAEPFRKRYARTTELRAELERAQTAEQAGYPASAAYYRGRAYAMCGLYGQSLLELHRAKRMAPRNGQVVALLSWVLAVLDRPLDAKDMLEAFKQRALREGFPLPPEFYLTAARVGWILGRREEVFESLRQCEPEKRVLKDLGRFTALIALLTGKKEILRRVVETYGAGGALDPEVRLLRGVMELLSGKAERSLEDFSFVEQTITEVPVVLRLAQARAYKAAGKDKEALKALRSLIGTQELLPEAWSELARLQVEPAQLKQAKDWLSRYGSSKLLLQQEWERIRGVEDPKEAARSLLTCAQLRYELGMVRRARQLLLVARRADRWNADVHRAVLRIFTAPEDAFERIHSLEALVRLVPDDPSIRKARAREYLRLGFTPPGR